jgi:hypothetical protein
MNNAPNYGTTLHHFAGSRQYRSSPHSINVPIEFMKIWMSSEAIADVAEPYPISWLAERGLFGLKNAQTQWIQSAQGTH